VIPTPFPAAADGLKWVRLHVLLSPLPSSLAWRRPRVCLCSRRGRTLAGAARITPPELPKLVRSPSHSRRAPAIEALRAIHLHLHGVSAEDLAAIFRAGSLMALVLAHAWPAECVGCGASPRTGLRRARRGSRRPGESCDDHRPAWLLSGLSRWSAMRCPDRAIRRHVAGSHTVTVPVVGGGGAGGALWLIRWCQAPRSSSRSLYSRTVGRAYSTCSGGIRHSGSSPAIRCTRRCRASVLSVLTCRFLPRNAAVSAGSARGALPSCLITHLGLRRNPPVRPVLSWNSP
jgi:hypothetical protein